jgi:hypothetical protein
LPSLSTPSPLILAPSQMPSNPPSTMKPTDAPIVLSSRN